MMAWKDLRPIVKERLEGVSGMGEVNDFIRHTRFWTDFLKRHVKDQKVHTWEFTRVSMEEEFEVLGEETVVGNLFRDTHEILVIGRMSLSLSGETEGPFQDVVDDVIAAFRADTLLGGRLIVPAPPRVDSVGHTSYGGVLVHEARVTILASERVSPA